MKLILFMLLCGFAGGILAWGDIVYYNQWEFYAIIVPFSVVLDIYGGMK